jgi:hypothetical protein
MTGIALAHVADRRRENVSEVEYTPERAWFQLLLTRLSFGMSGFETDRIHAGRRGALLCSDTTCHGFGRWRDRFVPG